MVVQTMIPLRTDISACDSCGECCKTPCLLGGPADLKRIAKGKSKAQARKLVDLDRTFTGEYLVRIKAVDGKCPYHVDMRCQIHDIKPRGAKEFKCWDASTYLKDYSWSENDLRKIGFGEAL